MSGVREWLGFVLASLVTCGFAVLILLSLSQPMNWHESDVHDVATDAIFFGLGFAIMVGYVIVFALIPASIAVYLARGRGLVLHLVLGPLVAFGAICLSGLMKGRGLPNGDMDLAVWLVSAMMGAATYFWVVEQGGSAR